MKGDCKNLDCWIPTEGDSIVLLLGVVFQGDLGCSREGRGELGIWVWKQNLTDFLLYICTVKNGLKQNEIMTKYLTN